MVNTDLKATMKVDSSNFDLTNITVGDYDTDKMADSLMEDLGMKKEHITINGHSLREDDDSVYCTACDEEYEIPQLLQESSGFNEVVYRLYVMGKFKESECQTFKSKVEHKVNPNKGNPLTGSNKPFQYRNNTTKTKLQTNGQVFMGPDGEKYHIGGGEITNLETGYMLDSTEKKELLGQLTKRFK